MDCQEARPSSKLTTCSFLLLVLSSLLCSIFLTVDKKKSQIWGSCRDLCRCPTFAVWLVFFFTSFRASCWVRCVIFAGQPLLGAQQPYIPPLWIKLSFCSSMNTHKKAFNFFFLATFLHLYNAQCFFCPVSQSCCDLGKGHTCQSWKKATRLHLYNRHFQSDLPIS